jgi:hypothetical protein
MEIILGVNDKDGPEGGAGIVGKVLRRGPALRWPCSVQDLPVIQTLIIPSHMRLSPAVDGDNRPEGEARITGDIHLRPGAI